MVLNFFQLRNHTNKFTFQLINSENNNDNYNVGPSDTTSRGDMWLAQGEGAKGVSVLTFADGAAIRPLIYMWDQNWSLRYRIGGETTTYSITVDSNKDFSIDVDDNTLTFVCFNGSFNSSDGATVKFEEWKDHITNYFSQVVSDSETIEYAQTYGAGDDDSGELRVSRNIQQHTDAQAKAIQNMIAQWVDDYLEHNRRQGTLYADGSGWRIDLQDNGALQRNGMYFYNIAVQYGSGRDNVYAQIMLPVGYVIGRRRIRNALLRSMDERIVIVIMPPESELGFIQGILYTSEQARTSWAVRTLEWECTDTSHLVWR